MTRENLQKLILKDDLKGIIDILLTESEKSTMAKTINGRLVDLNKQNNQGTIGIEAYNVERNRIRAALIDLAENEVPAATEKTSTNPLHKLAAFLLIPLLIGGLLYAFYAKSNAVPTEAQGLIGQDTTVIVPIKLNKINSPINYQLKNLFFSTQKEYRKGLAYLKKQYDWHVDVPVSIRPEDIKMEYHDSINTLHIHVQKVLLSTSFHTKNKKARILKNSLWIEPTAPDGPFWRN